MAAYKELSFFAAVCFISYSLHTSQYSLVRLSNSQTPYTLLLNNPFFSIFTTLFHCIKMQIPNVNFKFLKSFPSPQPYAFRVAPPLPPSITPLASPSPEPSINEDEQLETNQSSASLSSFPSSEALGVASPSPLRITPLGSPRPEPSINESEQLQINPNDITLNSFPSSHAFGFASLSPLSITALGSPSPEPSMNEGEQLEVNPNDTSFISYFDEAFEEIQACNRPFDEASLCGAGSTTGNQDFPFPSSKKTINPRAAARQMPTGTNGPSSPRPPHQQISSPKLPTSTGQRLQPDNRNTDSSSSLAPSRSTLYTQQGSSSLETPASQNTQFAFGAPRMPSDIVYIAHSSCT